MFIHLHNHTEYSLLDGLSKIPEFLEKAKELGQEYLAISDHGFMYGVHEFYVHAQKVGIKPILGCELYMARLTRFDKDPNKDKLRYHILLLAKNDNGYKNLMRLASLANTEGFYYKPRIDWEILEKYSQDLICTSACLQGEVNRYILADQMEKAETTTQKFLEIFKDDFYLEIQRHPGAKITDAFEKDINGVKHLSQKFGIPIVATNDIHYVNQEDAEAQDALLAIGTKKMVSDADRLSMMDSPSYYLKSEDEMRQMFTDFPEAINNTYEIAKKCSYNIKLGGRIMPIFPIPNKLDEAEYLRLHTYEEAKKRFPEKYNTEEFKKRLDYELDIIIDKGYVAYFLIYEDFTKWSKTHGVRIGPGRGSAAGSLVSYTLDITTIDPLKYNLPFERFLNPFRPTPPDIDMDFADDKREDTINYVRHKYGEDKVAQIITFGKMEARGAIRDIGRVLGFPYSDPDRLAKLIPFGYSIKKTLNEIQEFKEEYQSSPAIKKLVDLAVKVEGTARHASIHAAALVVAPEPFYNYCPLTIDTKTGKSVTQYDMHGIDCNVEPTAIGLLKMDFLGLRNLSILQKALDLVKEQRKINIDLDNLPMDDPQVYKMFSEGHTMGIFQMESAGMRRVARNLKPDKFSDIAALVALYRPGPMDLIDDFIAGKADPEKIKYPHDDLKPVLEETYGIAIYQEQCLSMANVMAGYSLGEADILRKAIGKKILAVMQEEKKKFTQGAKQKGYSDKIIDTVWGYIEKFAGYGFNKAHSVSYGMIAYQTAWMKIHYPVEYMTALLTRESSNTDKVTLIIEECNRMGIIINPPDINTSQTEFSLEESKVSLNNHAIRFGLSAIKNVGEAAISSILQARGDSNFKSLTDFFNHVDNQKVNKRVIESLIQVGAFDAFGKRNQLLAGYIDIRKKAATTAANKASGQISLFDDNQGEEVEKTIEADNLPEAEAIPNKQLLAWEKQLLGFYLTDNPITKQMQLIQDIVSYRLNELDKDIHKDKQVILGGAIASMRKVFTKKNNAEMAFVTLNDGTANLNAVVFPKIYQEYKDLLQTDQVVICKGRLDIREDELSFLIESISEINKKDLNFLQEKKDTIIEIPRGTPKPTLVKLNTFLKNNLGNQKIIILLPNGGNIPKRIVLPFRVNWTKELESKIKQLLK